MSNNDGPCSFLLSTARFLHKSVSMEQSKCQSPCSARLGVKISLDLACKAATADANADVERYFKVLFIKEKS